MAPAIAQFTDEADDDGCELSDDARHGLRKQYAPDDLQRRGTHGERRLNDAFRDLFQGGLDLAADERHRG